MATDQPESATKGVFDNSIKIHHAYYGNGESIIGLSHKCESAEHHRLTLAAVQEFCDERSKTTTHRVMELVNDGK